MNEGKTFQKKLKPKDYRKKDRILKKDNKTNKGITLIALIISIIVMLILAGVSLNAVIGDNGILTKAQEAKLVQEESKRREDLEYILYEYNSSSFLGQAEGFTDYLESLKAEGKIEDYLYTDTLIVKYDGAYYETEKNGDYYEIKNKLEDDLTGGEGGSLAGNNYIVTPDNLTSGGHFAGNGGTAGTGGNVKVSENATINAFNGNKYTDNTPYNNGENQVEIYGQNGIVNERYLIEQAVYNSVKFDVIQEYNENGIEKTSYINPISNNLQGIGTGAGYIEISNGTYIIDSLMN